VHIAYVTETYPPEINGVSLTVERTVAWLRRNGHRVSLVRPRQPHEEHRDTREEWRTAGLPIPMYRYLRLGLAWPSQLRQRWHGGEGDDVPQLVHVATPGPLGVAAARAARSLGLPLTMDFRTNFHAYSRYYRLGVFEPVVFHYLRRLHRQADCSFVPTAALRAALEGQGFGHVETVGRGIDTEAFSPTWRSQALRRRWGAADDQTPVLLYVGRLAPEKNVSLALRAFVAARRLQPELRMVVVGDGPSRAALQSEFPAAQFVGVQRGRELASHYASADLFVFPSLSETFGNVVLEAMASGLTVVAYRAGAAAEHVQDHYSGLLVRPDAGNGFIHAVSRGVAMAAERLGPMRERARQHAMAQGWDQVLQGFEQRLRHHAHQPSAAGARHVAPA
jgi:glycosyltransferase involved in cell wall biosynthesis